MLSSAKMLMIFILNQSGFAGVAYPYTPLGEGRLPEPFDSPWNYVEKCYYEFSKNGLIFLPTDNCLLSTHYDLIHQLPVNIVEPEPHLRRRGLHQQRAVLVTIADL